MNSDVRSSQNVPQTSSNSSNTSELAESPLDLTKSNLPGSQPSDLPVNESTTINGRKRSRKGRAFKLDALCLRLQEKLGNNEEEPGTAMPSSDPSSSPSDGQMSNRYPSPVESAGAESSDNTNRSAITSTMLQLKKEAIIEPNNNLNSVTSHR